MTPLFPSFFDTPKSRATHATVATVATIATDDRREPELSQVSQLSQAPAPKIRSFPARPVATVARPKREDHAAKGAPVPEPWMARTEALMATGLPREWAEPLARLLCDPPPGNFDVAYWGRLQPGANHVADAWAAKAHALGWRAEEVFGLDDVAPAARWDRKGIAWLIDEGQRVVALDKGGAEIITRSGARLRFYRRRRETGQCAEGKRGS